MGQNETEKVVDKKYSGFAIASLVLGVIGLISSCVLFGIFPAIVGLCLGIVAVKNKKKLGIMGIICSGIGLLVGILMIWLVASDIAKTTKVEEYIANGEYDKALEEIRNGNFNDSQERDFYYELYMAQEQYDNAADVIIEYINNFKDLTALSDEIKDKLNELTGLVSAEKQIELDKIKESIDEQTRKKEEEKSIENKECIEDDAKKETEEQLEVDKKQEETSKESSRNTEDEKKTETDFGLTYDLYTDVECGKLYSNKSGIVTNKSGTPITEYGYITILANGTLSDGKDILEGYSVNSNGKIIFEVSEEEEYIDVNTPLGRLQSYASRDLCETDIITNDYWLDTDYPEIATSFADDGSYFDEIVLGAWFDEYGMPLAGSMPDGVSWAITEYRLANTGSKASGLIECFRFIDGQRFTMDMLKRTSTNEIATYAMILTNVTKRQDLYGNMIYEGLDYISSTPVVIQGNFSGVLNGDDLLVFAEYKGLASDDTPNFNGIFIEVINGRIY